jgi:hypothetical protein
VLHRRLPFGFTERSKRMNEIVNAVPREVAPVDQAAAMPSSGHARWDLDPAPLFLRFRRMRVKLSSARV